MGWGFTKRGMFCRKTADKEDVMKCGNCGQECADDLRFCTNCGMELPEQKAEAGTAPEVQAEAPEAAVSKEEQPQQKHII